MIPAFNEAEGIINTLKEVINNIPLSFKNAYEIIVVDDGSTDSTAREVGVFSQTNNAIRLVRMRGNQGHMAAITAGLASANGQWILTMDADLQDPPSLIPKMIEITKDTKCEVVQAVRSSRDRDTFFKKFTATIYYRWMQYLMGSKTIPQGADFRLISKKVRDELLALPEKNKVYRLLIPYLGFHVETISFARGERAFGVTKYPLKKMIGLAIDSTISFSSKPLRSLTIIGGTLSVTMFVLAVATAIAQHFVSTVSGWTSIVCLILAGNSLILAGIGLLGEYISKIFDQVQDRPSAIWYESVLTEQELAINSAQVFKIPKEEGKASVDRNWLNSLAPYFVGLIGLSICLWSFHWSYLSPFEWKWVENSQPALLDVATSVASQQDFFRSSWQFPIGLVENYGYPVGTSLLQTATALVPTISLKFFAIVFGISSPIQSSGLTIMIGYFLLGLVLYQLFRFEGLTVIFALVATIPFFFIPKVFNNWNQPSLSWVWLIPLSIHMYRISPSWSLLKRVSSWGLIGFVSASTHTYFLVPILLLAFLMSVEMIVLKKNFREELQVLASLFFGTALGTWMVGGLNIGAGGSATGVNEVGPYATDILGLISTYGQSRFLPTIGHLPSFEGQAYLGLGLLFALVLAIVLFCNNKLHILKAKKQIDGHSLLLKDTLRMRGLVVTGVGLALIAIGPTLPFAGTAHPINLPDKILLLFSIFRASGRFIWLTLFLIGVYSLVFIYKNSPRRLLYLALPFIAVFQFVDTYPALDTTRQYISIVTNKTQEKFPYIQGKDIFFLPGYPDPATTPWRGQVFQTLQNGSKVHYFAYQGRYSPSKIGNSVAESLNLIKNPEFKPQSVVFVRKDLLPEIVSSLALKRIDIELIKMDDLWTAVRIK